MCYLLDIVYLILYSCRNLDFYFEVFVLFGLDFKEMSFFLFEFLGIYLKFFFLTVIYIFRLYDRIFVRFFIWIKKFFLNW